MEPYESFENYLFEVRRKSGLSQEEVATLLDKNPGVVRKYEHQAGLPELAQAIGLELIFDEPIQRLFAGFASRVRAQVAARARVLLRQQFEQVTPDNDQKLRTLDRIRWADSEDFTPWKDDV